MKSPLKQERGLLRACLMALMIWAGSSVVLLSSFCLIAYSTEDPAAIILPLSLCALYLSALICGIGAVRLSGGAPLAGLMSGLLIALILFSLSFFSLPSSGIVFPNSLFLTVAVIPASFVGSILGQKKSGKRKSPVRRRK